MTSQLSLPTVVLIRHAQSEWNRAGLFTGWADPPLTAAGRGEAVRAARAIATRGLRLDHVFSSRLRRARETAAIVLGELGEGGIPVAEDWRLNERHYGALQGEDKATAAARVGEAQVLRWRRGYVDRPPALAAADPRHPAWDPRWRDIPTADLPNGESLEQTRTRVWDFWRQHVVPRLRAGQRLMIASHGNTLRALIMALDDLDVAQVEALEIPTGVPILYAFSASAEPLGWHYLDETGRDAA